MTTVTKEIHLRQYDNLALKIFVRHLDRRLRDKIITLKPTNLEGAMAMVQDDQNFELFLQPQTYRQIVPKNNIQKTHIPVPNQKPVRTIQNTFPARQPHHQQNNYTHQNYFNNANNQPRQYQYPSNSQVFGKPINVWQPRPNQSHNLPKPVPMSGVSTIPANIPQNNHVPMSSNTRNSSLSQRRPPQQYHLHNMQQIQDAENADLINFSHDILDDQACFPETATEYPETHAYSENTETYDTYADNEYQVEVDNDLEESDLQDFLLPTQQLTLT